MLTLELIAILTGIMSVVLAVLTICLTLHFKKQADEKHDAVSIMVTKTSTIADSLQRDIMSLLRDVIKGNCDKRSDPDNELHHEDVYRFISRLLEDWPRYDGPWAYQLVPRRQALLLLPVLRRRTEEDLAQSATVRALFDKGVALLSQNRDEEALAAFSQLANRSGDAKMLDHLDLVARALFNKGVVLGKLNRLEDGLAAYDEVLREFGETETPATLEPVANALLNKSAILGILKRPNEVLTVCGQLLRRFDSSQTPEILDVVANALCNKGLAFVVTNRPEEALSTFDDLLRRFGQSERPAILEPVAKALVNKGMMLGRLNRLEDELAAYEEVVRRFGDSDASALLEWVAWAIAEKLRRLTLLNRQVALHDIEALLRILPRLDPLPPHAVAPLIALSVEIGPDQMLKLIQDSPTADLLPPLTTALEREMGLNPRVPEEVGEVAEDIRQSWEKLRKNRSA